MGLSSSKFQIVTDVLRLVSSRLHGIQLLVAISLKLLLHHLLLLFGQVLLVAFRELLSLPHSTLHVLLMVVHAGHVLSERLLSPETDGNVLDHFLNHLLTHGSVKVVQIETQRFAVLVSSTRTLRLLLLLHHSAVLLLKRVLVLLS